LQLVIDNIEILKSYDGSEDDTYFDFNKVESYLESIGDVIGNVTDFFGGGESNPRCGEYGLSIDNNGNWKKLVRLEGHDPNCTGDTNLVNFRYPR
jgi:hypothetical protein